MARLLAVLLAIALCPALALAQARPGPSVRPVTGATDTILNTDCGNIVQFNRASAIAVTLPQPGSSGNFNPRCQITMVNIGAGNATVTPTSSQIDGRASVVLQQGGGLSVTSSGGQWVSNGIFPALALNGLVDGDQIQPATALVSGTIRSGTCIEMGGTGNRTASISQNCRSTGLGIFIDGGGSAITTGIKGFHEVPFGCTITAVRLRADQPGSVTITIKKAAYNNSMSSIVASAKPTLSSAQWSEDTTLTGWTTTVSAGEWLEYTVDTVAAITQLDVSLPCVRT